MNPQTAPDADATHVLVCDPSPLFAEAVVDALRLEGFSARTWDADQPGELELSCGYVALIDGDRPATAIEATRLLRSSCPQMSLVLIVSGSGRGDFRLADEIRAQGVVWRDARISELVHVLHDVANHRCRRRLGSISTEADIAGLRKLTDREREVLRLVGSGHGNTEIADELQISIHTVRTHMQNIHGKLGVSSRFAAATLARHHGLLERTTG